MILYSRSIGAKEVVALRLNETTLDFVRRKSPPLTLGWTDPSLKLDLSQIVASPEAVLPKRDARATHPQWVDVFQPPSRRVTLETTLSPEAFTALIQEVQNRKLTVNPVQVAFYWHRAPRSPGWLAHDVEGQLGPQRTLNGRIIQVRGSAWKGVTED